MQMVMAEENTARKSLIKENKENKIILEETRKEAQ